MAHQFDALTEWCLFCGCGRYQAVEKELSCTRSPNVIAISHRVRGQTLRLLCEQVRQ